MRVNGSSREVAEHATFQSFANCYAREIDPGTIRTQRAGAGICEYVEWNLATQGSVLRVDIVSRSLCGPHRFGPASIRRLSEAGWRSVEPLFALQALVHECYRGFGREQTDNLRSCELELLVRLLESYQSIAACIDARRGEAEEGNSFIAAEQSLIFGHWLHPTPKSRQGMAFWQQPSYAPELGGGFQLTFFAVHRSLVRHNSAGSATAADLVAAVGGASVPVGPDEILVPMHPLQADALRLDPDIQSLRRSGMLREVGPAGPPFTATSSVRTVYSPDCPWMLKFSLPVRITNSVRLNRRHELEAGVCMARLFDRTGFCAGQPKFQTIQDPAYITLDLPGRSESGFEVIFRENPFTRGSDAGIVTVAALTADPLPGQTSRLGRIVRTLADQHGGDVAATAVHWFSAYLDCALDPLLALYDEHGIALEAHQQNSVLDISTGYPSRYYYRDNQGFYLSNRYREHLHALVPEAAEIGSLYFDDEEIQDCFAYYLVVNQVFSVIARMGHDGLAEEEVLVGLLRERLGHLSRTLTGAGAEFARRLLRQPSIAAKANLLTRLLNIDELEAAEEKAVYSWFANPLRSPREGQGHAIAS